MSVEHPSPADRAVPFPDLQDPDPQSHAAPPVSPTIAAAPAEMGFSNHYLPALDGFRAVSILIVVVAHIGLGNVVPGLFGVAVFFFISGFLITRIIMSEHARIGRIRFGNFYIKRFLRLFPTLIAYILVSIAVVYALGGTLKPAAIASALFYFVNIYEIVVGYDRLALPHHPFAILWSLAVEEHFYFIYPLCLAALVRRRSWAPAALGGFIVLVLLWRWALWRHCLGAPGALVCGSGDLLRFEHGTDTRLDSIAFGCLAAFLCADARDTVFRYLSRNWVQAIGIAVLLASFAGGGAEYRAVGRFTLQGFGLAMLLPAVLFVPRFRAARALLEITPMIFIGRVSYALYMFHYLALGIVDAMVARLMIAAHSLAWYAAFALLTALGTLGAYWLIEVPMQRWRRAFGSNVPVER